MVDMDRRQGALRQLLQKADEKGYLLMDYILDVAGEHDLSLPELDRLVSDITVRNVEILEAAPMPKPEVAVEPNGDEASTEQLDTDFRDRAHVDYNALYIAVAYQCPSMEPLVQELRSVRPPQKGETRRLLVQCAEGNVYARNRIIEMYSRLALRCAYLHAQEFDLDLEETFGDAVIGLIRAVDLYRSDEQTNFAAYATVNIRRYLLRALPGVRKLLYYPAHAKGLLYNVYKVLKQKGCIDCEEREKCPKMKAIIGQYSPMNEVWLIEAFYRDVSLDEILETDLMCDSEEQTGAVEHLLPGYLSVGSVDKIFERFMREDVRDVVSCLKPKEQDILCKRFGIGGPLMTLEEIGNQMGVTRERVRQIEKKGLERFRKIWVQRNAYDLQALLQKNQAAVPENATK